MKKILSILLAVLIIAQMMVNVGIGVYYHLNRAYIAKELCINKNNPAIHCEGHCYLANQLKNAEQKEKQSAQSFKEKDEVVSDYQFNTLRYFPHCSVSGFMDYITYGLRSYNLNSLIKPPSVA